MQIKTTQLHEILNLVTEFMVKYSFNILGAVIILVLGFWIATQVAALFARFLGKKGFDATISHFGASVVKFIILFFAVIMALDKLGITMTPFVAALSGAAFGASFAFQGPLMNYGAGLTIILTRPFVIGDTITVVDCSGVVEEINLAQTILKAEDGIKITIPNKHVVGEVLYNSKKFKMVDQKVNIAYSEDPGQSVKVILRVLDAHADIARDPLPQVGIAQFGDSGIQIGMRYWVPTEKYFQIMYAANMAVFNALKEARIAMPFPQLEVRMINKV
jgi:small conductance mechanosensitive channel